MSLVDTQHPTKIQREEPASPSRRFDHSTHSITGPSRIPQPTSVMKPSTRLNSKNQVNLTTPSQDSTRDSTYSTMSDANANGRLSGVITRASAISLQRAAAHTRAMGGGTAATLIPSPRAASVEKSIGVTIRSRKSRDGSTKINSRGSLTAPSSKTPAASVEGVARATSPIDSNSIPRKVTTNTRASDVLPPSDTASKQLSLDISKTTSGPRGASSDSSPLSNGSTRPPISTPTNANQFLSPITPTFPLVPRTMSFSSQIGSIEDLNPYSDAWGQNSSVAAETAMGDSSEQSFSMDTSISTRRPRHASITSVSSSFASRSVLSSLTTSKEVAASSSKSSYSRHLQASSSSSSEKTLLHPAVRSMSGKEEMLEQLLASLALIDSRPYTSLTSIEEVESYKKELIRVEKRMNDVQHKLKVEMRVREAADKLRKTGLRRVQHAATTIKQGNVGGISSHPSTSSHLRMASISSNCQIDAAQAEADVSTATKRTDAINKELVELKEKAMMLQRKLLEHQTRILALRVSTLEEEQAGRMQSIEEEEKGKVSANLAIDEVERTRDKLQRAERSLEHEKRDREEEVDRWKKKHEEERIQWQNSLEEGEQRAKMQIQDIKRQHEIVLETTRRDHTQAISEETSKRSELQGQLQEQLIIASKTKHLQDQLEQLEFEMTAERKIMSERQQLFMAFEKRLNRAETRLRQEDDRCAQLLGKVDGREEMDTMLDQIKAGYGAIKKEKTAGQDIDGLIDSIATHIGDLEDELRRAGRSYDGMTHHGGDLEFQLEEAEKEVEIRKNEAESAKRELTARQRQSTVSVSSTRMSVQARSRNILNANATSEAEARLALMEKRNAALEAELTEARLRFSKRDSSHSPPAKVAGMACDAREVELLNNAIQGLLCTLPSLDPMCMDLRKLQRDLSRGDQNVTMEDVEEICQEVMDRSRTLITISTRLIDRTLACENKQEAFESELVVMEEKCEDLRMALEDLRRGKASHMAREKKLQSTVNELHKSLTAKTDVDLNIAQVDNKLLRSSSSCSSLKSVSGSIGLVSRPSQSNSLSASVASRRSKGIPKPLSISQCNSNLSFTPSSSINSISSSSMFRNMKPTAVMMPPTPISSKSSSTSAINVPPRSMTLGLGPEQLRLRVRQLESELIQAKAKAPIIPSPPEHTLEFQDNLLNELQEHKRELEYVKGVESKQRIDLLDELTTLTGELSEARAQLRAEQRKNKV